MNESLGFSTHFLTKTVLFFYTDWVFPIGCLAPGHTVLLAPIKALPCLCFFRPWRKNPSHPLCGWSVTHFINDLLSASTLDGQLYARNHYFSQRRARVHKVLIKFIHLFLRVLRDLRGFISVSYRDKVYFFLVF